MKRICSVVFAPLLAVLLFTQCKKEDPNLVFNTVFYTTEPTGKLTLYINGANKGVLPYFSAEPGCGSQPGDGKVPLAVSLKSGSYQITGKDSLGGVISSGTIRISKSTMGVSGTTGGMRMSGDSGCLAIGLYD